jgi:hypothetical protein
VDAMCEAKVERCARAATQSLALFTELPRRCQLVEKLLRALLCPRFGDRIRRLRSVLDMFSRSLGEPTGPTTTFSTRWCALGSMFPQFIGLSY